MLDASRVPFPNPFTSPHSPVLPTLCRGSGTALSSGPCHVPQLPPPGEDGSQQLHAVLGRSRWHQHQWAPRRRLRNASCTDSPTHRLLPPFLYFCSLASHSQIHSAFWGAPAEKLGVRQSFLVPHALQLWNDDLNIDFVDGII